jgi:hypothetical protein
MFRDNYAIFLADYNQNISTGMERITLKSAERAMLSGLQERAGHQVLT